MSFSTIRKALTGGVTAGVAAYTAAATSGPLTQSGWVTVVVAFLVGSGLVYAVPNAAPAPATVGDAPFVPDLVMAADEADPGATA